MRVLAKNTGSLASKPRRCGHRLAEIEIGAGPQGQFDAEHLKAIHRHLFQDVYEWAGHTRDERFVFSDGAIASEPIMRKADGQPFPNRPQIPAALRSIGTKPA